MPFEGESLQYRVRGEHERFERIAQEHELAEITMLKAETVPPDSPGKSTSAPRRAVEGR